MAQVGVDRVDPWRARRWWLALMTNAIGLVDDAAVLTMHCSYGPGSGAAGAGDRGAGQGAVPATARPRTSGRGRSSRMRGSRCRRRSRRWVVAPQSRLQVATQVPGGHDGLLRSRMTTTVCGFPIQNLNGMVGDSRSRPASTSIAPAIWLRVRWISLRGTSGCSSRSWLALLRCTSQKIAHASSRHVRANHWTRPRISTSRSFRWPGREDFEALMASTREHRGVAASPARGSASMGPSNHQRRTGWLRRKERLVASGADISVHESCFSAPAWQNESETGKQRVRKSRR